MCDPDRSVVLLDVLAAVAAGAVGIDAEVVGVDLDVDVALGRFGHDLDEGEAGVAGVGGIEGGDADEAVNASF